jgi:hypothetical protein
MKSKLAPGLLAALALTALVVSALAQDPLPQSAAQPANPGGLYVVPAPAQDLLPRAAAQPAQNLFAPSGQPAVPSTVIMQPRIAQGQPDPAPPYTPYGTTFTSRYGVVQAQPAASPEEVKLSMESDALVRQLGEAKSEADKEKLKTQIAEVLEKQFDLKRRRHEAEVEALEAQIKKLKDMVRLRNENRRQIISVRLEQILRDAQGLGW